MILKWGNVCKTLNILYICTQLKEGNLCSLHMCKLQNQEFILCMNLFLTTSDSSEKISKSMNLLTGFSIQQKHLLLVFVLL